MFIFATKYIAHTGNVLMAAAVLILGGCYATNDGLRPADGYPGGFNDDGYTSTLISTTIASSCIGCNESADLNVSWNKGTDNVDGYKIYYGPTPSTATRMLGGGGDEDIATDPLYLEHGKPICFRVTAYVDDTESDYSEAVCINAF